MAIRERRGNFSIFSYRKQFRTFQLDDSFQRQRLHERRGGTQKKFAKRESPFVHVSTVYVSYSYSYCSYYYLNSSRNFLPTFSYMNVATHSPPHSPLPIPAYSFIFSIFRELCKDCSLSESFVTPKIRSLGKSLRDFNF